MSLKVLFSICPVLRCTTIMRASSRFLAGCWAIRFNGRSNLNCESSMYCLRFIDRFMTQTVQKLRLTKRKEADRKEILFYPLSVHLGLTAQGWSLALKSAKIGLLKK